MPILEWMIYSSTHDAVASSCGKRLLYDNFCSKRDALRFASRPDNHYAETPVYGTSTHSPGNILAFLR